MEEQRAQETGRRSRKKKRGSVIGGIFKVLGTLIVIGILTAAIFCGIFYQYVRTALEPEMDVDASAYTLKQSSVIYYKDKTDGSWVELRKLYGEENRTIVDYDQIPDHVVKALIAIEDERFYEHQGVDWKRTIKSVLDMFMGKEVQGGSTITQQVIKNLTGESQVTIRRKVLEIFRALRFRKNYTDEEILEIYFNKVYFGQRAYGIEAAAQTYFGKDVSELSVAEGAAIVGITQNPWKYNPLRSEWSRTQNRNRQLTVLYKMNELGWLSDSRYEAAKAEKLVFVGDQDYVEDTSGENDASVDTANLPSYFEEQVFNDVVDAFMEQGYSKRTAQEMLYNGGYKIYCTLDPDVQKIVEEVYADRSNLDYVSEEGKYAGEYLQSGMTVINNETNNIVAIAGHVGDRQGAFEWSYAASTSPCGSAIKPLSVYAPALDAGIITPASVLDDYPMILNGERWPVNAYSGYNGLETLQDALRVSSNPPAVRVLQKLGTTASYAFMTENLGFTSLDSEDMYALGALGLGGLHNGVSTIEMAAAYSTFACNGVYTRPRTFTEVRDYNGQIVIDNKQQSWPAMKETTVFAINELLKGVVRSRGGTGTMAALDGMTMAGKTGTTNSRRDRYFIGYTPYYTAAVWVGYPHPARITAGGNPAADMWKKVMSRVHEGLPDKDFPTDSSGMTAVTVCTRTGLRAGPNCPAHTVLVAAGSAPTLVCDGHVEVRLCEETGMLARDYCPEEGVTVVNALDLNAPNVSKGFGYKRELILNALSEEQLLAFEKQFEEGLIDSIPQGRPYAVNDSGSMYAELMMRGYCTVHTEPPEPVPIDINDPTTWPEGFNPEDPTTWPEGYVPEPDEPEPPVEPTDPENPTTPAEPTDPDQPVTPEPPNEPSEPEPPEPEPPEPEPGEEPSEPSEPSEPEPSPTEEGGEEP